jgi:hypothetical protein
MKKQEKQLNAVSILPGEDQPFSKEIKAKDAFYLAP